MIGIVIREVHGLVPRSHICQETPSGRLRVAGTLWGELRLYWLYKSELIVPLEVVPHIDETALMLIIGVTQI
jgi:hypothetical protein